MQIYLDTADLKEIRRAAKLGVISGVTTNPSLMMRAGRADYRQVAQEICYLVQGPVSAEVVTQEAEGMVEEAQRIAQWSPFVVVKIPATAPGLQAISALAVAEPDPEEICQDCAFREECAIYPDEARELVEFWGIRTNATLTFSVNQALLAAAAGANYVSPFIGRLDDAGADGMQVVRDMVAIFDLYGIDTEVIAASIRHPMHVTEAALAGADIATVPYAILERMIRHPLTEIGLERFLADWAEARKAAGAGWE